MTFRCFPELSLSVIRESIPSDIGILKPISVRFGTHFSPNSVTDKALINRIVCPSGAGAGNATQRVLFELWVHHKHERIAKLTQSERSVSGLI